MKKKETWLLVLIVLLGIFFRFYLIGKMPGGLFPDEAANGLDINNIFKHHFLPFFARGNGREALFFYLEAIPTYFFGRGAWQFHVTSAAIGTLSILGVYLLGNRLYGRKVALLAAFFMAAGTWHIILSRTAFRAILIPLFTSLTFYFMARAVQAQTQRDRIWSAIFAGAFFAGGFYTYIAYRIMLGVVGVIIALLLIADRKQGFVWVRQYWQAFLAACASAIVVFAPIGYYFLKNPGSFIGRSGQVSVFNSDLNHGHLMATVINVVHKSLAAFFTVGDVNWRQNISGYPFLSPLISPFFGITLVVLTVLGIKFIIQCFQNKQNNAHLKHIVMLGLFWGMLVPVATTAEGIPHGLRSVGMVAPAYILSAVGVIWLVRKSLDVWHQPWMEKLYLGVAVLYLAAMVFLSYEAVFVYAYNNPDEYAAFRSDLTIVSQYLNQHPDKQHDFLVLDRFSSQTVDYLTTATGNSYQVIDPANSDKLEVAVGDHIIFTSSTLPDLSRYRAAHQNTRIETYSKNRFGNFDLVVLKVYADNKMRSLVTNSDGSFAAVNLKTRVDFSWDNISFDPWEIKIWLCDEMFCLKHIQLKDNQQNDYLANNDWIQLDAAKRDVYFKATAYQKGKLIKNFGIIKMPKWQ